MSFGKYSYLLAAASIASFAGLPTDAVSQTTNAWATQCVASSLSSPYECVAQHQVRTSSNQRVFEVNFITRAQQDGARLDIVAPLGFHIPGGVVLLSGEQQLLQFEITSCTQNGCFASSQLTTGQVDELISQPELELEFYTQPENVVRVPLPVAGLSDSLSLILN